ncbi:SDR family NAD(P)-dependent oxidoreductase [Pseudorhodoplanes sp.]|uniref:SDR family NAD(P)-dependent oxidoreductase n=1 Tax=Pseudorhodoplanes sp. TaxID=1934341 RepID=UPI003D0AA8DD
MTSTLKDKTALVIGGTGGIGAACAEVFASQGAKVIITHRPGKADAALDLVAELSGSGHQAFPADVADTASLLALRNAITSQHGSIDILVNAAGFTRSIPHADLSALDDEVIDQVFAVNWRGQFATIRTFAPLLKASGNGLIVLVSSIAGNTGIGSSIAYCAVKAGIDVMVKSLARVLAPEVRVVGVAPGVVDTAFVPGRNAAFNARTAASTPLRRIATPFDIADAILACATHLTFSTGTTIVVDGGRSL